MFRSFICIVPFGSFWANILLLCLRAGDGDGAEQPERIAKKTKEYTEGWWYIYMYIPNCKCNQDHILIHTFILSFLKHTLHTSANSGGMLNMFFPFAIHELPFFVWLLSTVCLSNIFIF